MFGWQELACEPAFFVALDAAVRVRSWRKGNQLFGGVVGLSKNQLLGWQENQLLGGGVHWQENELFLAESWLGSLRLAGGIAGEQYDVTSW
jgi:hypothetical protein